MADKSPIEWTEATWNPVVGCSILSPGCTHCYAMKMAARIEAMSAATGRETHYAGTTKLSKAGPVWTGKLALAPDHILTEPLRWKRPRRIFVNSISDLFHENVPDEWIDKVFAVMSLAPQHTFQVLTKRARRMREYVGASDRFARVLRTMYLNVPVDGSLADEWPLPNVWLGISTERQQESDERVPELLATPAAVRFVSAEPLLGPIDYYTTSAVMPAERHPWRNGPILQGIDLVIVGGESGHDARPMHPDWARSIRDQCAAAGTVFFFKQWGAWGRAKPAPSGTPGRYAIAGAGPHSPFWPATIIEVDAYPRQISLFGGAMVRELVGKKRAGRMLDGREHNEMPGAR